MIDWSQCPAAESRPGKLSGAWVFYGTRVPLETLFVYLRRGVTLDEFLDWFEGVSREQVLEVLGFVEAQTRAPRPRLAEPLAA